MSFERLMTDTITVIKSNGKEFEGLKASVQGNKIFIEAPGVLIEPDDIIRRNMSNGGVETFTVIDPGFYEKFHGIPAHYQMTVKKLGLPEAQRATQSITYNLSGANARVNDHAIDNSTNIVKMNPEVKEQLEELRQEVLKLECSDKGKGAALGVVDAIQEQFESGSPSKTVVQTLLKGLSHISNAASIGSFLLSAIGV